MLFPPISPQSMDHFDDIGPSVVMASPGMMQSGLSRELFESWCTDKRNGVIIAGYCVEGTLAKVSHGLHCRLPDCSYAGGPAFPTGVRQGTSAGSEWLDLTPRRWVGT